EIVLENPKTLVQIESIIHPLVKRDRENFIKTNTSKILVFDIPLLFETGGEKKVDYVCVVSAPRPIQIARVMARPGMTRDKLNHIMAVQVPDVIKRRKADFVIPTGNGKSFALMRIRNILNSLKVKTNA
ncbi:MAG: dephospho-CoA kinase, partial [Alphaproteobacteria bacterium]|nr:dephospho-CoA kinase [Alphaproteobacteria bacterium]